VGIQAKLFDFAGSGLPAIWGGAPWGNKTQNATNADVKHLQPFVKNKKREKVESAKHGRKSETLCMVTVGWKKREKPAP